MMIFSKVGCLCFSGIFLIHNTPDSYSMISTHDDLACLFYQNYTTATVHIPLFQLMMKVIMVAVVVVVIFVVVAVV